MVYSYANIVGSAKLSRESLEDAWLINMLQNQYHISVAMEEKRKFEEWANKWQHSGMDTKELKKAWQRQS